MSGGDGNTPPAEAPHGEPPPAAPAGWAAALEAARERVDAALRDHGPPLLIYQMGKVASATLHHSLRAAPELAVFHVHRMSPANIERDRAAYARRGITLSPDNALGLALHERLCGADSDGPRSGPPARIVTLVREPIGRNVSAFFQNLDRFVARPDAHATLSTDELREAFVERFPHDEPLTWFDHEWGPVLGLDPWRYPQPRDRGWQHVTVGRWDLVWMRHDLPDADKLRLLQRAWELPGLDAAVEHPVVRNRAADKPYAAAYARFLAQVRLPEALVEAAYASRYATHFLPADERARLRRRWLTGPPAQG